MYLIYGLTAMMVIYFLTIKAFPKLVVSEAVYGDYYWPKAPWLFVHVVTGIFATLIGPFQFVKRLRTNYVRGHRLFGFAYMVSIFLAALTAIYLAVYSGYNLMSKISLGIVPFIWIGTTGMAFAAAVKKRFDQHQEWMVRSYVVTLFFIAFVMLDHYLPYSYFGTYEETLPLLTWACWAFPLFVTELILQGRKIFS